MAALVDPVAASAQRQHGRDVETWAADASALLESQGIDTSEMTDAQMAALVEPVAASAQRQHERDVEAWAADASAWLESQGIDTSEMTDAQMAEMVDPAEMAVDRILDQIAGRMDAKDIGMLGSAYGLEGVQDYVSGVPVRRLDGETDAQYMARVQERNNPRSQDTPWWAWFVGSVAEGGDDGLHDRPQRPAQRKPVAATGGGSQRLVPSADHIRRHAGDGAGMGQSSRQSGRPCSGSGGDAR